MSGHSKWSTIKRKKGANDAKRGKLFAKLIRAIEVAAKNGGTDPANNASLYQAISKAKSMSVPNSNIENALKRLSGQQDSDDYEEVFYEGYGPHGVAILVECLTDNRNRTSSDVKSTFSKSILPIVSYLSDCFNSLSSTNSPANLLADKADRLIFGCTLHIL